MRRIQYLLIVAALGLVGCEESHPGDAFDGNTNKALTESRFRADYQSSFRRAETQANHGIYIVTDTITGQRYLAIEGCGVSVLQTIDDGKGKSHQEEQ